MSTLERARRIVGDASALLVCAGAGMGVDSGLPDFRGPEGFWRAYPPYRSLGLDFVSLANPRWFRSDPELAWGFYGHRMHLYRDTVPHDGFHVLRAHAATRPHFVFTSNVDGQFQKAGFDEVAEVHGSIHALQCLRGCGIVDAAPFVVTVDLTSMRAQPPLPACPRCGALLRPNVLMFGDGGWDSQRSDAQLSRLQRFLTSAKDLVVVECGAGTAVPTVRHMSERLLASGAALIRINLRESDGPPGTCSLAMGAKEALLALLRD